jgi:catechol 2,3-dioxygenase-like lactoylglutathione lyase family enzyme
VISGFHTITLRAADVDAAAGAYGAVLDLAGHATEGGVRFAMANVTLELRPSPAGEPEGIFAVTFATPDLEGARRTLERRGAASRLEDGLALIDAGAAGGVRIALTERAAAAGPAGAVALDHLVVHTADADRAAAFYGARLGLDLRLDRSNPDWGSRLLFFRCGDAVVEVAAKLGAPRSQTPDTLGGVALRTPDPDAAQSRLARAGFDVSETRPGRKPGTRVFTVRSGLAAGPALMIGQATASVEA